MRSRRWNAAVVMLRNLEATRRLVGLVPATTLATLARTDSQALIVTSFADVRPARPLQPKGHTHD